MLYPSLYQVNTRVLLQELGQQLGRFAHPDFDVRVSEEDLAQEPHNYCRLNTKNGMKVLAYSRDPYFAGWPDTIQLNYRHPGFRAAMTDTLLQIRELCDGVRCDMAM